MIDVLARRQAAAAIRHFVTGQITNEEFLRRYPYSKHDPAIWALDDTMWCLYDDVTTHKLTGKHSLSRELKKEIARWLLFLYSETEYRWPKIGQPGFRQEPNLFCRLLPCIQRKHENFKSAGDYTVWPFRHREELEQARKKAIFFKG